MSASDFLGLPLFWAFVFAMACGLIAGYFLLRQALVDAHFEIKKREDAERKQGTPRGTPK